MDFGWHKEVIQLVEEIILDLYARGVEVSKIGKMLEMHPQKVLKIIGEHRKKKREEEKRKEVCYGCRWRSCIGAPICYRRKFG